MLLIFAFNMEPIPGMNFVGINVNPMAGGRQFMAPVPIERISFVKEIQVRSLSVNPIVGYPVVTRLLYLTVAVLVF